MDKIYLLLSSVGYAIVGVVVLAIVLAFLAAGAIIFAVAVVFFIGYIIYLGFTDTDEPGSP